MTILNLKQAKCNDAREQSELAEPVHTQQKMCFLFLSSYSLKAVLKIRYKEGENGRNRSQL
jgi:hypothetical protein